MSVMFVSTARYFSTIFGGFNQVAVYLHQPILSEARPDLGAGQVGCKVVDFRSFHPFSDVGSQHIINELPGVRSEK